MKTPPVPRRVVLRRLTIAALALSLLGTPFWVRLALAAPQKDVVYASRGKETLRLDVYGASSGATRPALIFVHGGAWSEGSKSDFALLATWMAIRGYVCFTVSYRLVGPAGHTFPAQLDDVQTAVRWIGPMQRSTAQTPLASGRLAVRPAVTWHPSWAPWKPATIPTPHWPVILVEFSAS